MCRASENTIDHRLKRLKIKAVFGVLPLCLLLASCASSGGSAAISSKTNPQDNTAGIHAELAANYLSSGQLEIAREELEMGLDIQKSHSDANYVSALLMLRLNELEEADEYFRRAIKSNSANAAASHDYGVFLCRRGRYRESVDYFLLAADNPLFTNSHLSLSRAGECIAEESIEEGEALLRRALDVDPSIPSALAKMAEIRFSQENFMGARAYVERYISVVEPDARTLLLGFDVEQALHDTAAASKYRDQLLEIYPESAEAIRLRASTR